MALTCWLPLLGTTENQGSGNIIATNNGAVIDNNGKIGKCYSFNGNNYYIALTGQELFDCFKGGTAAFSICMWVYHADTRRAVLFGDYGLSNSIGFNIELSIQHGLRFYWNGSPDYLPGLNVGLNTWNHIALTYDGASLKSYLNGNLVATRSGALATRNKVAGEFRLGRDYRTTDTALNGKLNDIRVYGDHCLSAAEVHEISQGLVLHYKLDNEYFPATTNQLGGKSDHFSGWGSYGFGSHGQTTVVDIAPALSGEVGQVINKDNGNYDGEIATGVSGYQLNKNDTITFSAYVKGNGNTIGKTGYIWIYKSNGTNTISTGTSFTMTSNWQRVKHTITWTYDNPSTSSTSCYVRCNRAQNESFYISNCQLEYGTVATGFTNNSRIQGIIQDSSGYNNNGSYLNTISISTDTPRYSACTNLEAGNSMINCGRGGMVTDSITVNLWIKSSAWGNPVSCTEGGGWNFEATGDYFRFPVYISGVGYKYGQTAHTRAQVCNNQWHMLTGVYDRLKQKVKIYVDGELDNEVSTGSSNNIGYNGSNVIWLGAEATGSATAASNGMAGLFSDFRIYCTPLLDTDIKQLYNVGMKVDNLGGVHGYEFIEEINNIKENEIVLNTTDKTINYNKDDNTYTFLLSPHSSGTHMLWYPTKNRTVANHSVEIPWGCSFVHTFEIFSDKTTNLSIDYNDGSIDSDITLSGNDNDTNRLPASVSLTENTWETVTFSYSNTNESKNPNHVTLYDYSYIYVAAHDDSYTIKVKSPMTYVVDNDSKMSISKNGIISYNQFLESSTKNYGSISKKTRAVEASTFIEM